MATVAVMHSPDAGSDRHQAPLDDPELATTTFRCLTTADVDGPSLHRLQRDISAAGRMYPGRIWNDVVVRVTTVEPGRWFTAGRRSDGTLISGSVPAGLSDDERAELMLELSRITSANLDQPVSHVTVAIVDR